MPLRPDEMDDVRRIVREEIVLALAVKLPKVIHEPEVEAEKPVVKKAKKVVRKKGW